MSNTITYRRTICRKNRPSDSVVITVEATDPCSLVGAAEDLKRVLDMLDPDVMEQSSKREDTMPDQLLGILERIKKATAETNVELNKG